MKYCRQCLYNSFKPDIYFDESGLCAACIAFADRVNIDWKAREREFAQLCESVQKLKRNYDVVIGVSGGKDSHYQVIKAKEYGLNILAVNARTDSLSTLGRKNLDNIANLCDVIEVANDAAVRKKISKYALMEIGDSSWPEHITVFTVPVIIAQKLQIPLVLYGESPQSEYGGPKEAQQSKIINERWLSEFGGLNGLRVSDLIEQGLLPEDKAMFYKYPKGELPQGIFLGQYFEWDGYENALESQKHGFKFNASPVEGIGYCYENLDNLQTGLRDYLKYVKYGFGRATDLVNNHIRRNRLSREQAIIHCGIWDGQYPATYLGKSLEFILAEINCTIEEYHKVIERFYNKDLFTYLGEGRLKPKFEIGVGLICK